MSATRPEIARHRPSGDTLATGLVTAVIVLLLGVPSELIVKPLGAAGTPAQIVGVGLLALWVGARLTGRRRTLGPVGWLLFVFTAALVLSYVAGASRPVRMAEEANSSDRALISLAAWCGIALAVGAGLTTMRQLTTALRVLAAGAVVVAALGILQFTVGLDIARLVHIPGLTANHPIAPLLARGDFRRVTGTADHPIEFGVVLSSLLPLSVHHARFTVDTRSRRWWWTGAGVIAAALPMAVARSGILGAVVVSLVVLPTLPARLRWRLTVAVGVGTVAMSFAVPGLLGTIRGLILNAASDPSTQGRQDDYPPLFHYIAESPWLGRGPGTFVPSLYRTLDNQYLGTAVETGLIGLGALLALLLGTTATAVFVRSRSSDPAVRSLCVSLAAGILAFTVNAATFDLFGFAMAIGTLFVLLGATAAVYRIVGPRKTPRTSPFAAQRPEASRRRRGLTTLAVVGCVVPVAAAALVIARSAPDHLEVVSFVVEPPLSSGQGDVRASGSADGAASVLHEILVGPGDQLQLARAGLRDPVIGIGEASLMWGSDIQGYGPALTIAVQARTAAAAAAGGRLVLALAERELAALQTRAGVPEAQRFEIDDEVIRDPVPVRPRPVSASGGWVLLAILMAAAGVAVRRDRRPPGTRVARHLTDTPRPPDASPLLHRRLVAAGASS